MRRSSSLFATVCALLVQALPAQATSFATFVSSNGTDAGSCPITAPCKTFQFAHDQTTAGGSIIVLSSGSFGAVNITKSISILADGAEALIDSKVACPNSGTAAICVSGALAVYLRGLTIDLNKGASDGINFASAKILHVQNCLIRRVAVGIRFTALNFATQLFVSNSAFLDSTLGIDIESFTGGSYRAALDNIHLDNNSFDGILLKASSGSNKAIIRNSVAAASGSTGVQVEGGGGSVNIMIDRTVLARNGIGFAVSGPSSVGRIGDSTITGNGIGLDSTPSPTLSYVTNDIIGNGTDGAPTGTLTPK